MPTRKRLVGVAYAYCSNDLDRRRRRSVDSIPVPVYSFRPTFCLWVNSCRRYGLDVQDLSEFLPELGNQKGPLSDVMSDGRPCLKKTTNWSSYLHCLTPDDDLPNYSSSSGGYYFRQSETDYRHGTELGCSPPIVDTPTILVDSRTIPLANLS